MCLCIATGAQAGTLSAGVGKADIQPPTGYPMMGWVRADAKTVGQHTRLFARVLVLERDGRKVALVAEDLNGIPGGMLKDAAALVRDRGFSEQNVLASASHTHAGPTGYFNFPTYNTVFPSAATLTDPSRTFDFNAGGPPDPRLYTFLVRRLATAIRRADDDRDPAVAGWGATTLAGLTRNRSIEAHLANHGILEEFGSGSAAQDPDGVEHTIDPEVNVLRVDKLVARCAQRRRAPAFTGQACAAGRRRVPIGAWSTFADHGTVNRYTFSVYNQDHHGAAIRVFEDDVRRAGAVPRGQEVLNVYGNTDEGDVSAGLDRNGPAYADEVGRREARAMLAAWRSAGRRMSARPPLETRWTRICFCGQRTDAGSVDTQAVVGLPLLTGSEEGRGPLFDLTQVPFEGRRAPVGAEPQGHKLPVVRDTQDGTPRAVPLMAVRAGDRMVVSVPGEMTAEMGRRVREAVLAEVRGSGVERVVIAGLANEYVQYFTTPEEYDRQHYEGGSTLYGRGQSNLIRASLVELAGTLARGNGAPPAYPYDPTKGVRPDGPAFGTGAARATAGGRPASARRLGTTEFRWRGGAQGADRPLDRAFVSVQRRVGDRWRAAADDLGLEILWTVDRDGDYRARWEVPRSAAAGTYRFRVSANRYRLSSQPFRVRPSHALTVTRAEGPGGRVALRLGYPAARLGSTLDADLLARPATVSGGTVRVRVGTRSVAARYEGAGVFSVAAAPGTQVSVAAGAARDRYGNRNRTALRLRG